MMLNMHTHPHSHKHTYSLPTLNPCRGQVSVNCFPCSRWMNHSVGEDTGRCQERKEKKRLSTNTHTLMKTWQTKGIDIHSVHTNTYNLTRVPASTGCYQLISASSCGGQPYWHRNDTSLVLSGTVSSQTVSFWFNYKYTDAWMKLTSSPPRRKTLLSNAVITWMGHMGYCVQTDQSLPNEWLAEYMSGYFNFFHLLLHPGINGIQMYIKGKQ